MIENDRLIAPESRIEEQGQDWAIRPKTLSEYVGQPAVVEQVGLFMDAARACLLYTSPSPRDMRRSRMPSSA